ncbi:MAG: hypothetical protein NT096_06230 [Proteobacteria bacterium]|nr:hypothetical protein [Pseudomonadota bacterium]
MPGNDVSLMVRVIQRFTEVLIPFVIGGAVFLPPKLYSAEVGQEPSLAISEVSIDREIFNPSLGEKVGIHFRLSKKAKITLKLFDFDQGLIATIWDSNIMEKGEHVLPWDGRDQSGKIVPDEAYFFTIETVQGKERIGYNPTDLAGGINHEIEQIKVLPEQKQLEYFLPEKGRVCIKAGIVNGPLLAILVNWEPRDKGLHRESWDGMDEDKIISVLEHPQYRIRTSYFTLPENTIITTGNKNYTYLQYQQTRNVPISKTSIPPKQKKSILTSPLYNADVPSIKAFPVEVTFPQAEYFEEAIPPFAKKIPIKVDVPAKWKILLAPKQYEIYLFLDYQFMTEDPSIQLPYQTVLNVEKYATGMHILTVNLINPVGQICVKNLKVQLR